VKIRDFTLRPLVIGVSPGRAKPRSGLNQRERDAPYPFVWAPGPASFPRYGRIASSKEADELTRAVTARASRTTSDLVRFDLAAMASSLANSGFDSFTVTTGIEGGITSCAKSNTEDRYNVI
jgi:hypothetical protein